MQRRKRKDKEVSWEAIAMARVAQWQWGFWILTVILKFKSVGFVDSLKVSFE